jgi:acyl carrier protein
MSHRERDPDQRSTVREQRMAELCEVVAGALGVPRAAVDDRTSTRTLAEWDSLGHLQVLLAVETRFGARFCTELLPDLDSVRALALHLGILEEPKTP